MYTANLDGKTILANVSGGPMAFLTKAQATAEAKKVKGEVFQIRPNGGAFYVRVLILLD